jgi:hypothetical protein
MSGKFNMEDYVDVAERQRLLFERYPDARIQVDLSDVRNAAGELISWKAKATIWRNPEDPVPVCDWAVEPVPGKTPFTRDSEAMNASTSAVGRAIVLAGFETKKIASKEEVRARQESPFRAPRSRSDNGAAASDEQKMLLSVIVDKLEGSGAITREQLDKAAGGEFDPEKLTKTRASNLIERLERFESNLAAA